MNRLYRSRSDSIIAGVCGGLGRHLALDPVLVRIVFVLLGVFSGLGIIGYFLLWIFLPYEDQRGMDTAETIRTGADELAARARAIGESVRNGNTASTDSRVGLVIGAFLVGLGGLFLLRNLDFPWLSWLNMHTLWPLILVGVGVALLWRRTKGD